MPSTITGPDGKTRCAWAGTDPLYVHYHDSEWGVPQRDDRRLFEKICLEGFQSGLSWITVLRKRENFRRAFRNFEIDAIAKFTKRDVNRLLKDEGIIRHRGKIESAINNARRAKDIVREQGSLSSFLWRFRDAKTLAKELKRRGWTFVGPTTIYAFMQACGIVNDHAAECFRRSTPEKNLTTLLRTMEPELHPEPIVFCGTATPPPEAIATFHEREGLTVFLPKEVADRERIPYSYVAAWITLTVHSDLDAIGFLAAISQRLAAANISCNVVSALYHDHLFVPFDKGEEAVRILRELQTDV